MIIDLQNYEKLLCFFKRKVRKDYFLDYYKHFKVCKGTSTSSV